MKDISTEGRINLYHSDDYYCFLAYLTGWIWSIAFLFVKQSSTRFPLIKNFLLVIGPIFEL